MQGGTEDAVLLRAQNLHQLIAREHKLAGDRHQIFKQVDVDANGLGAQIGRGGRVGDLGRLGLADGGGVHFRHRMVCVVQR